MNFSWDDNPDLNITPFVDVMLVLMSILMVTAPTITYEEKIELPEGTKSKKVDKRATITIRVDRDKNIYIKNEKFTLKDFADTFMLKSKGYNLNSQVFIRADKNLKYGDVMEVLKVIKDVGFSSVSLITQ
ncbi:MAG: ExbD/TolR family protein [Epsilonproteobacteria bacterium]|nr:ExbD/TolR family protein [Campylobacterota bacterium]